MDKLRMFHGAFKVVGHSRDFPRPVKRWFIGWQDDQRILWLIPTTSSRGEDHITGCNASQAIKADWIMSILDVSGIRAGTDIAYNETSGGSPKVVRLLNSEWSGPIVAQLRRSWNGWNPDPEPAPQPRRRVGYWVDGEQIPDAHSLGHIAIWFVSSSPNWTATVGKIKAAVAEKYGADAYEIDEWTIEINGHTVSKQTKHDFY